MGGAQISNVPSQREHHQQMITPSVRPMGLHGPGMLAETARKAYTARAEISDSPLTLLPSTVPPHGWLHACSRTSSHDMDMERAGVLGEVGDDETGDVLSLLIVVTWLLVLLCRLGPLLPLMASDARPGVVAGSVDVFL